MAINVGDKAPDFTLPSLSHSDEPVEYSLNSFKGKKNVLLLFFSQAFSGVCSDELSTVSEGLNEFAGSDAQVFGISVDGTFVHNGFAKAKNIVIPLLSDFNKEVVKKYDIVQEAFAHGMKNVSKRAVFLIDKDGVVRYKEITENPGVQVNFEKIKEAIRNLK